MIDSGRAKKGCVIRKGTPLPEGFILVEDEDGHMSLEPARAMTFEELKKNLTDWLELYGEDLDAVAIEEIHNKNK